MRLPYMDSRDNIVGPINQEVGVDGSLVCSPLENLWKVCVCSTVDERTQPLELRAAHQLLRAGPTGQCSSPSNMGPVLMGVCLSSHICCLFL